MTPTTMISASETVKDFDAQRQADARLHAVRTPWYTWQAPCLQIAAVTGVVTVFFAPDSIAHSNAWRAGWITALMTLVAVNQYLREKAWRRLVESEAPELYRKLTRKHV